MRKCWPAPRQAVPLRMSSQLLGKRVQSKFCSSNMIVPTTPASELTPTPNINRPVIVSSAVTVNGKRPGEIAVRRAVAEGRVLAEDRARHVLTLRRIDRPVRDLAAATSAARRPAGWTGAAWGGANCPGAACEYAGAGWTGAAWVGVNCPGAACEYVGPGWTGAAWGGANCPGAACEYVGIGATACGCCATKYGGLAGAARTPRAGQAQTLRPGRHWPWSVHWPFPQPPARRWSTSVRAVARPDRPGPRPARIAASGTTGRAIAAPAASGKGHRSAPAPSGRGRHIGPSPLGSRFHQIVPSPFGRGLG